MVVFSVDIVHMQTDARGGREGLDGMFDHLSRQRADHFSGEVQVHHSVRPAGDVHDSPSQGLVQRAVRRSEPLDACGGYTCTQERYT